jgi:hypothetical protein
MLLGVVSLIAGSTTGVPMSPGVWSKPNCNAAALIHNNNIRNNRFLDHQGSRVLHHSL